jgi:hypothetical protein
MIGYGHLLQRGDEEPQAGGACIGVRWWPGVAGREPLAGASVGWMASITTSARRSGSRSRRRGVGAPIAVPPAPRCSETACWRSRAAGGTRSPTSCPSAGHAMPASAMPKSPDGCGAGDWTSAPSCCATLRSTLHSHGGSKGQTPSDAEEVGFEAAASVPQQPWSWLRMMPELRFGLTGGDRSYPARTGGSRCRADPARTSCATAP